MLLYPLLWTVFVLCSSCCGVQSAVVITVEADALQSLKEDVRALVMPSLLEFLNYTVDLSISTQVGTCCKKGDTGVKVSILISNLRWNYNNAVFMVSEPLNDRAQLAFTSNNAKIETSVTAQFTIAYGYGVEQCNPVVLANLTLPQFSFAVEIVKNTTSSTEASFFHISLGNVQIEPLDLNLTVQSTSTGSCKTVVSQLVEATNYAADLLSAKATEQFLAQMTIFFKPLLDTVPVGLEAPIDFPNGQLYIRLGLQSVRSSDTGVQLVLGATFSSTLQQPAWRQGYSYQRPLPDTPTADFTTTERQVQFQFTFPAVNQLLAAVWHQVWAGIATDATAVDQADYDFCVASENDPCPFPPIRTDPLSAVDTFLLQIGFPLKTAFKYHVVVEPPVLAVAQRTVVNPEYSTTETVLQGRVPTKVVLRGTSRFAGKESTLAVLSADVVFETDIPGYDDVTDRIVFAGFAFRIENAEAETRFRLSEIFVQAATKFLNQFIARRLMEPINQGIAMILSKIPVKIPTFQNLPLLNYTTSFQLPDFLGSLGDQLEMGMNLDIDIRPLNLIRGSAAVAKFQALPAVPQVNSVEGKNSLLIYSSASDSATGESVAVLARSTAFGFVEQYRNGAWVPV